MKILVAIDEHENWEPAVAAALDMLGSDGELVLGAVGELAETSTHEEEIRGALDRRLSDIAAKVDGVPVRTRISLGGDPVHGLTDLAEQEQVDRIVLGSHQGGGLEDRMGGSEELRDEAAHIPITVVAEDGQLLVHERPA